MSSTMAGAADVNVEALLGGMNMETLMAFADNDFEAIYERLQEPFDDLEQRIVVSSMVQEAVSKGFLKAIEEESQTRLACKDTEIESLQGLLKAKDDRINDLQKVLGIAGDEASSVGKPEHTRFKQLWDFLHESQQKWGQSEAAIAAKEREIERLANNMACLTLMLDNESRKAAMLEKQLNELKEQDAIKSGEISSCQQDIVKLKLDKSSLSRQARLKRLQFDESLEHARTEIQQLHALSENILQEKRFLEKNLEVRDRAFSNLETEYRGLESQMHVLDEQLKNLVNVESKLRELIEEQAVIHKCEQDLVMTCLHEQMKPSYSVVKKYMDLTPSSCIHKAVEESQFLPSIKSGPGTTEMVNDLTELTWKTDAEGLIVEVVMDGWYREIAEVLHKMTLELAWKDEEFFFRDEQLGSLKQAVEELENDYATLMSICLTLIRDQTDNDSRGDSMSPSVHDLGRRKLMELSEFLSSRDAIGSQEEKDSLGTEFEEELSSQRLRHDLKPEIVSEVLKEENALEGYNFRDFSAEQEAEFPLQLILASAQFQHKLELEIVCELFSHMYKEAFDLFLESRLVESNDRKICDNFEELGPDFESFMELQACKRELEACRLEKIGCSTSIAKCEFKLDKLMKSLSDQVNKMNAKISLMQDAIKQQEWKHVFEEDILTLVVRDSLVELQRNLKAGQNPHSAQVEKHVKAPECHSNPLDKKITTAVSQDAFFLSEKGGQRLDCSQQIEGLRGGSDKDKVIISLRKGIEELRKEKAELERRLDKITEELYSLKRQFWKEKEIWTSKLSPHQKKEMEAQVNALSRHSSVAMDLEEDCKKLEEMRFDALVSGLKKEWLVEKENLTSTVLENKDKVESLEAEIVRLREKEKDSKATEAGLLARIADLKIQADNLSSNKLNEDFHFANCKQVWLKEKESMRKEIEDLLEKNHVHAASEACISAQATELERQAHSLSAEVADLDAINSNLRQAILDQEAANLKLQKQVEEERESLLKLTSERDDLMNKTFVFLEKEKSSAKRIEELETEINKLAKETLDRKASASHLTAENDIAFAAAVKDKLEEEKKTKALELQLQDLRLEVKSMQDLNTKVTQLEGKLETVPRQLELTMAQQFESLMKASNSFEQKIFQAMQENSTRLNGMNEKCNRFRLYSKKIPMMEVQQRQRLAKELVNLQKAEAEVDLLADEVDSLLGILEEVHGTFDLYAPVIVHYPKMKEVARVVKQEIQLRIDPKYGA